jgi:hypothetical protein
MVDKECRICGFDYEGYGCTCPHSEKWYACPIESSKPENKQALMEWLGEWYPSDENSQR